MPSPPTSLVEVFVFGLGVQPLVVLVKAMSIAEPAAP